MNGLLFADSNLVMIFVCVFVPKVEVPGTKQGEQDWAMEEWAKKGSKAAEDEGESAFPFSVSHSLQDQR